MKLSRIAPLVAMLMAFFCISSVEGAPASKTRPDQCLSSCNCTSPRKGNVEHKLVKCTNMTSFIEYVPPGTTDLSLTDNFVDSFTAEDLVNIAKGLKTVKNLIFSYGILKEIPVLHGFPRLRTIDFSNNLLGNLTPEVFSDLKHLKTLNLRGNPGLDCARMKKALPNVTIYCDDDSVLTDTKPSTTEESLQESKTFDLVPSTEEPSSSQAPVLRGTTGNTTVGLNFTSDGDILQETTERSLDQSTTQKSSAVKALVGWMGLTAHGFYFFFFWARFFC